MAKGYLTTHVLDTAKGCPAEGVTIQLYRLSDSGRRKIAETITNSDGRTDAPILPEEKFKTGTYELVFFAGDYLRRTKQARGKTLFLDQIPIRFGMSKASHFHVPLLLSAHGYGTYRGS